MTQGTKPNHQSEKIARKSAARLYAVQALFQLEASGQTVDSVQSEFLDHRFGAEVDGVEWAEGDADLFRSVTETAVNHQAAIDQLADRALVSKWPIARIDPTLRAVFRAAGAELLHSDAPVKVVITEYVRLAEAFFPEGKEKKFVNGVVDHMAREARPEDF